MTVDISWFKFLCWASGSQLLSTCITLGLGSYVLYKWQKKHDFEYEVVRGIMDKVQVFADEATRYWSMHLPDGKIEDCCLRRIRVLFSFESLSAIVQECNLIKAKRKDRVHDSIGRLYDCATAAPFDSSEEEMRKGASDRISDIQILAACAKKEISLSII